MDTSEPPYIPPSTPSSEEVEDVTTNKDNAEKKSDDENPPSLPPSIPMSESSNSSLHIVHDEEPEEEEENENKNKTANVSDHDNENETQPLLNKEKEDKSSEGETEKVSKLKQVDELNFSRLRAHEC